MNWRLIARVVLTFWLAYYAPNPDHVRAEGKDIAIKLSSKVGLAPHSVRITVRVEPHELNRKLCLVWGQTNWDPTLMDASCREQLPDGPITTVFPIKTLREPGEWIFVAVIYRSDDTYKRASDTLEVYGGR